MTKEKEIEIIASLRKSYNQLERKYFELRRENDRLCELTGEEREREKETKSMAKNVGIVPVTGTLY